MTSTAQLPFEPSSVIALQTESTETSPSAISQRIALEDVKLAILSLIRENNAEFKQFLLELMPNSLALPPKKTKKKTESKIEFPPKKERIPYSEMPFWKANPDLKPHIIEGKGGLSNGFWNALDSVHEAFNDVTDEEWDKILEDLKNDR